MDDQILGEIKDSKCPKCGSKKIFCYIQYPLVVKQDMNGKIVRNDVMTGKRLRLNKKFMASEFVFATHDEYQVAQYKCDKCGWTSEPYTP